MTITEQIAKVRTTIEDLTPGSQYLKTLNDYINKGHLSHAGYINAKQGLHKEALSSLDAIEKSLAGPGDKTLENIIEQWSVDNKALLVNSEINDLANRIRAATKNQKVK